MILQSLVDYYETQEKAGRAVRQGWGETKVSYALCIDERGRLKQVATMKTKRADGKEGCSPRLMELPMPVKRTLGIAPNFLWDNASYLLGADNKGRPQRSRACFAASRALHEQILQAAACPAAAALLAFFEQWEPEKALQHPALQERGCSILSGVNLVFWHNGRFLQENEEIRQAWQRYYDTSRSGTRTLCLVTGERDAVQPVHPAVKGVEGAQPSGAALVSFNAPAFCSYGREQSLNAPVGRYAAFAYTTALNLLLADKEHLCQLGDTTLLCWARSGESAYQDLFLGLLAGKNKTASFPLQKAAKALCGGKEAAYGAARLRPDMGFTLLALSPNASRLSVRFFGQNTFSRFLRNLQAHQQRLHLLCFSKEEEPLFLPELLEEAAGKSSRERPLSPEMAGETLQAVLCDACYPVSLLHGVMRRIRAERRTGRARAAMIKAYYLKNPHPDVPKEVLTVSLNTESTSIPYTLGRLFCELEGIQHAASPGAKSTIRDKYFTCASTTPGQVFPLLVNRAQRQLSLLEGEMRSQYDRQLSELADRLGEGYPARMNLPQQGAFQLGYYHQAQARRQKRGEGNGAAD